MLHGVSIVDDVGDGETLGSGPTLVGLVLEGTGQDVEGGDSSLLHNDVPPLVNDALAVDLQEAGRDVDELLEFLVVSLNHLLLQHGGDLGI